MARVFYYRCDHCANVSTVPKDHPNDPPKPITGK
jgi:hypothetical protein